MLELFAAVILSAACGQPKGPPALLIVAPQALAPALEEFAAFKRKELATEVEVVELEHALAASAGGDDPEKLKRFLFDRWNGPAPAKTNESQPARPPLGYVLLVGDADVMPVRYMVLDRNTEAAFNYAFYPSDLYYADLAKADGSFEDWNAVKDDFHKGYYGEVRGEHFKADPINYDAVHYVPEVALGRWPVNSPEEVKIVAAKTMAYERSAAARPAVAMVASGGWIENRPQFDALSEMLGPDWAVSKLYWAEGGSEPRTPPPDEGHIVDLINAGAQLVLHSGHGTDTSWEGAISTRSIRSLRNEKAPAIMISAGCSTARLATLPPYEAYLDVDGKEHAGTNNGEVFAAPPPPPAPYQKDKFNPTGLGEQLLRAGPTGAVAYIGCNTGSQPCGTRLMEGVVDSLARRQIQEGPVRLGDCWKEALAYYYACENLGTIKPSESWYPASIFFQGMKFMLYGDPSIPIRVPPSPAR